VRAIERHTATPDLPTLKHFPELALAKES
jgi:hypothetical protein